MTKKVYRYHNQPFGLVTHTCLTEFGFTRNLAPGLGIRLRPGINLVLLGTEFGFTRNLLHVSLFYVI